MRQKIASTATQPAQGNHDDPEYDGYIRRLQLRFELMTNNEPLFTTDAVMLFEHYLASMPVASRQFHNCNCCRRFIERYGSLVVIDQAGNTTSAVWNEDDAPHEYKASIAKLKAVVESSAVTGVFLSSDKTWGEPKTGLWTHLCLQSQSVHRNPVLNASQTMTELAQGYLRVQNALATYSEALVQKAVTILRAETLYRSEKVLGPVEWLWDLQASLKRRRGRSRSNIVWKAVAKAPAGFSHVRSGMAGTLLDDLAVGFKLEEVKRRFDVKMNPSKYQRPQAPPLSQPERFVRPKRSSIS
jgi:hypothetical protein